jgi:hypothetical protein
MSEQWVLLWSQKQNATHIERLEDMLSSNRKAYRDNRKCDYLPIFIGERGHVEAAALHCSSTLMGREFGEEPQKVAA